MEWFHSQLKYYLNLSDIIYIRAWKTFFFFLNRKPLRLRIITHAYTYARAYVHHKIFSGHRFRSYTVY